MHTSWSEVNLWNKCKQAHHYRYDERIQRRRPIIPMLKGKILHDMLHNHVMAKVNDDYEKDAWDALDVYREQYDKFFKEEQEEYGDIPGECERIFLAYLRRYKNDDLTYEGSEELIETNLTGNLRLKGFIDKRAVDKKHRRWIMDHKFHKNIPSVEERFHDLQLAIYVWAWNREHPETRIDGICWDYVRTMPPTEPEVLKNGQLSKRKNIRCDRATYEDCIKREGLKKKDYEPFLRMLDQNENMFFERVFLPAPSKKMIDQIISDFRTTAVLIDNLQGIHPRSMNKFNCTGCEFRALCEAEVRGLDVKFVKKSQYQPRENDRAKESE